MKKVIYSLALVSSIMLAGCQSEDNAEEKESSPSDQVAETSTAEETG